MDTGIREKALWMQKKVGTRKGQTASSWDAPSGVGMWHPAPAITALLTQRLATGFSDALQLSHRIIESLRLENISKTTKSSHQPNTTMPAKPYPEVPHLHVF